MKEVVNHVGKIVSATQNEVLVQVERGGACAGCSNKTACMFGDSTTQVIPIKTSHASSYVAGEEVTVSIQGSSGLKAVWYAYILPFILLITTFILVRLFIDSEPLQILFAFVPVALYYFILYKTRDKMDRKFNFSISKI